MTVIVQKTKTKNNKKQNNNQEADVRTATRVSNFNTSGQHKTAFLNLNLIHYDSQF